LRGDMPWLVNPSDLPEGANPEEALLLVHIPRTGGTSFSDDYDIPGKAGRTRWLPNRLTLMYFFYRYNLLKNANFPVFTWENLLASCSMTVTIVTAILFNMDTYWEQGPFQLDLPLQEGPYCQRLGLCLMPYICMSVSLCLATASTFLFTAPSIRSRWARGAWLVAAHSLGMECKEEISGAGCGGLLMHLTAEEIVRFGHATEETLSKVSSMAVVRNPYARMVSLYMYSRFGTLETFDTFVRRWYVVYQEYKEAGEWGKPRPKGEWSTYCHRLPMHLYVLQDVEGQKPKQLIKYIIRLEDKSVIGGGKLPEVVQGALENMSHSNARPLDDNFCGSCKLACCFEGAPKLCFCCGGDLSCCGSRFADNTLPCCARDKGVRRWQDHYTPELAAMVLEMYQRDFDEFGYSTEPPVSQGEKDAEKGAPTEATPLKGGP